MAHEHLPAGVLGIYVIALIVLLHGTTPVLYDQPRYPWTYKHLGVVELIVATGRIERGVDVYNNWPGFFAVNAWLTSVSGVRPIDYAEWAQIFFNLVNVLVFRFVLHGVTSDERLVWTAIWVFVLGNWVGQDYFAPQAMAYPLALVVLGLCLRCGSMAESSTSRSVRSVRRVERRVAAMLGARAVEQHRPSKPLSARAAVFLGGGCYLALVLTHPLSPVMIIISVSALWVVLRRVPLWIPIAMAVVEVWWVTQAWPFISDLYDPLSVDVVDNISPRAALRYEGLPGLEVTTIAGPRALVALMVVLGFIGLVRRLRAGYSELPAAVLILAPVPLVFLASYGSETGLRTYLFALPWLAFLVAADRLPPRPVEWRTTVFPWRLGIATAAIGGCLLCAYFGLELANRIRSEDVRAAIWLEQNAAADSVVVYMSPDFPKRLTARYPAIRRSEGAYNPHLIDEPPLPGRYLGPFEGHLLGAADVPAATELLGSIEAPETYLVLSRSQEAYVRLYGVLPDESIRNFAVALLATPNFEPVYRDGFSTLILRWRDGANGDVRK